MGRPRIGTELKKPSDYNYDYPENRDISRHITISDRKFIAEKTGYSNTHVFDWCRGRRKNSKIKYWAKKIASLNIVKQKKLEINPDYRMYEIPVQMKKRITA